MTLSSWSSPLPTKAKVLVVGDHWRALSLAHGLCEAGVTASVWLSEEPCPRLEISTLGNGEEKKIAQRIFGEGLAERFWTLSEENLKALAAWLDPFGVPRDEGRVRRNEGEVPAMVWNPQALVAALKSKLGARVVGQGPLREVDGGSTAVRAEGDGGTWEGDLVVWCTSRGDPSLFPWLEDRWIPVTLTTFYRKNSAPEWQLPNGGADYQYGLGGLERVGSYRSLMRDDRVGVLKERDDLSERGVRQGFQLEGDLEWENHVEGVTCDGLPLIGSLPDPPTVFTCGGFGGREANFWFALIPRLVRGLTEDGTLPGLEFASTRRFI